jgi:CBS domain-containing protein
VAGDITAGPGDFVLGLPVPGGMPGDLRLSEARVTATVALNGVSVRHDGGRVVGVVTEADLATALETVPPNLLPVIQALLEPDLDRDNDGVPDAYSACITYTSRPVSLAPDP